MRSQQQRILAGLVSLVAAFGLVACAAPQKYSISPETGYYDVEGSVTAGGYINGNGVRGKATAQEMGLDDEVGYTPNFWVEWEDWLVGLSSFYVDYSGNGVASADLVFGDNEPIRANTPINSDVSLGYLVANGLYRLFGPDDFVQVGLGVGLGAANYDVSIKSEGRLGGRVQIDDTIPFGYLSGRVWKELGPVTLTATGQGIAISPTGYEIDYYELSGSADYKLWDEPDSWAGRFLLGYRYLKFRYIDSEGRGQISVLATVKGPFASLILVW